MNTSVFEFKPVLHRYENSRCPLSCRYLAVILPYPLCVCIAHLKLGQWPKLSYKPKSAPEVPHQSLYQAASFGFLFVGEKEHQSDLVLKHGMRDVTNLSFSHGWEVIICYYFGKEVNICHIRENHIAVLTEDRPSPTATGMRCEWHTAHGHLSLIRSTAVGEACSLVVTKTPLAE